MAVARYHGHGEGVCRIQTRNSKGVGEVCIDTEVQQFRGDSDPLPGLVDSKVAVLQPLRAFSHFDPVRGHASDS